MDTAYEPPSPSYSLIRYFRTAILLIPESLGDFFFKSQMLNVYLPTFGLISMVNVGKYAIH